jgi:hypothetical protein
MELDPNILKSISSLESLSIKVLTSVYNRAVMARLLISKVWTVMAC